MPSNRAHMICLRASAMRMTRLSSASVSWSAWLADEERWKPRVQRLHPTGGVSAAGSNAPKHQSPDLEEQANFAKAQANEKHRAWCGAMVRHLLNPERPAASLAPVLPTAPPRHPLNKAPDERRARLTAMFEAQEKREKRGALQRLADGER